MNALATDQAKRFAKAISSTASLKGTRVGLYIGSGEQNPHKSMTEEYVITDKDILGDNPPDILLTNYKMLDFMLMRPRDQKIWKHNIGSDILKFIAVDEIHTFDGAQGTDLASLLRRLYAKLEVKKGHIACIGTSATLGSDGTYSGEGIEQDYSMAIYWYTKAIERDNTDAYDSLKYLYNKHRNRDHKEVKELYKGVENDNLATANYSLGNMAENSLGMEMDMEKALNYYKKAMGLGHKKATVSYSKLNNKK